MLVAQSNQLIKILAFLFCLIMPEYSSLSEPSLTANTIVIDPRITLPIGVKVWFNESGGTVDGLIDWNNNEKFASLGIGHFLWYPKQYKYGRATWNSGFPGLVRYIATKGVHPPAWMAGANALHCPWGSREEFLAAKYSQHMLELQEYLRSTIQYQAEYMVKNLPKVLPTLLARAKPKDRPVLYNNFQQLASTPSGIYGLVDYLNFKGAGIGCSARAYESGSGLLQVLLGMAKAPRGYTPLRAYVWSAKQALRRRVANSHPNAGYGIWLKGWLKRVDTYLEGDLTHMQVII